MARASSRVLLITITSRTFPRIPRMGNRSSILCLTAVLSLPALAQTGAFKPPEGPVPRMADGKPDLSGVWDHPFVGDVTKSGRDQIGAGELPFTAWGLAEWKNYNAEDGDATGACLPHGLLR